LGENSVKFNDEPVLSGRKFRGEVDRDLNEVGGYLNSPQKKRKEDVRHRRTKKKPAYV
jgi:hypothetical protein